MISKFSVKKPYTVFVGIVLVIVLGVVSFMRMVTNLFPDVSFPYVLVVTVYPGATPEEVETRVTSEIESGMASTTGIQNISSTSADSYSMVILEYDQNVNMDSVIIEIQQQVDMVKGRFPENVSSPTILRISPDMLPVMAVAVSYEGMDEKELKRFVDDHLIANVEAVEGTARVTQASSVGEDVIKVTLDEEKINALNDEIQAAVNKQFSKAGSSISSGKRQINSAKDQISQGAQQLTDTIDSTTAQKEQLFTTREDLNKNLSEMKEKRDQLLALQETPEYQENPALQAQASQMLIQINEGIASIETGLAQVDAGEITLNNALQTISLNASVAAVNSAKAYSDLAEAAAGLNVAQSSLDDAKKSALDSADANQIISKSTVSDLLKAQDFDMPAGYLSEEDVRYIVRVGNKIDDFEEFKNLTLVDMGMDDVGPITLDRVAKVEIVSEDTESYAVVNGRPGILLSMQKQTGYSTGESAANLKKTFDRLTEEYDGLKLDILMDQSVYIDFIVENIMTNMVIGALLSCLVLILFLRNVKVTVVIACAIPISVVFALTIMYFTGVSLNILSLSGLALSIGMLVDNSIVAVENVYRLRAEGYSFIDAAIKGVNEILGAITASTLTTICVFAPIVFTEGLTKQMFVDLALTVLYTLCASLFIAMTLVPAMSGMMFKKEIVKKQDKFSSFLDRYERLLDKALSHKVIVFVLALVILGGSMFGVLSRGLDFLDMDIEANQMSANITAPEGKTYEFEEMTGYADEVVARISEIEGIKTVGAMYGSSGGMNISSFMGGGSDAVSLYMVLEDGYMGQLKEIGQEVEKRTEDLPVEVNVSTTSTDYTSLITSGISMRITGRDIDKLQEIAGDITKVLEGMEQIESVDDGMEDAQNQLRIRVDREGAAKYSYTVAQVYQLVASKLIDTSATNSVELDPYEYDVYIETSQQQEVDIEALKALTFEYTDKEGNTEDVSLSEFCTFENDQTLGVINRYAQQRQVTVSARVKEGYNVTLVSNAISEKVEDLNIPDGYEVAMTGEDQEIRETVEQLMLMLILAIIFIYLIMVAQFQSIRAPFIIMFTIPLAFTGGFIGLFVSGFTLNVVGILGFVMLSGLIVNNGIVLIDYINKQREEGMSKHEAILKAGRVRLRPVLMTVLTTVLSMVTIALGIGEGTAMMQPMAIVIIGGLLYGTLLTLFIVPCIYDVFFRKE